MITKEQLKAERDAAFAAQISGISQTIDAEISRLNLTGVTTYTYSSTTTTLVQATQLAEGYRANGLDATVTPGTGSIAIRFSW